MVVGALLSFERAAPFGAAGQIEPIAGTVGVIPIAEAGELKARNCPCPSEVRDGACEAGVCPAGIVQTGAVISRAPMISLRNNLALDRSGLAQEPELAPPRTFA